MNDDLMGYDELNERLDKIEEAQAEMQELLQNYMGYDELRQRLDNIEQAQQGMPEMMHSLNKNVNELNEMIYSLRRRLG